MPRRSDSPHRADYSLDTELAQVVVEMLIHQLRPLVRRETAEKGVRMCGAPSRPADGEPIDQPGETRVLRLEVARVADDEIRRRRGVRPHRFVVAESEPFDQRTDDTSDQHARRPSVAERHLQSRRTMGDRLRDSHRAPQPLMPGLQPLEPCLNIIDSRRFEESSHAIQDEACVVGKCSKPRRYLTPWFSCKHSITIAAKPHPKSACHLQRSLGGSAI
jgi:hypothetical protein